jgi:hypothetical protein
VKVGEKLLDLARVEVADHGPFKVQDGLHCGWHGVPPLRRETEARKCEV